MDHKDNISDRKTACDAPACLPVVDNNGALLVEEALGRAVTDLTAVDGQGAEGEAGHLLVYKTPVAA